jgi:hypothetical protein
LAAAMPKPLPQPTGSIASTRPLRYD